MITWKTLSALMLAAIAAWTLRSQWRPAANPSLSPSIARMRCIDANCQKVALVQLRTAEDLICPHCSGRLAPLTPCPHCGHQLILAQNMGRSGPASCPECHKEIRRED